jgi:hypothetical protein
MGLGLVGLHVKAFAVGALLSLEVDSSWDWYLSWESKVQAIKP